MTVLEQGLIGRITKVEASLCNLSAQRAPDCYLYDSQQGGVLLDVGIFLMTIGKVLTNADNANIGETVTDNSSQSGKG